MLKSDFCITIDFDKKSENPCRIFQTMNDIIACFQEFDKHLIHGIDSKLEPVMFLEDVQIGSLKTWLYSQIKNVPDEALKEGDWRKFIGEYLYRAKYFILKKLEPQNPITRAEDIKEMQKILQQEAEKTGVKLFPSYYAPSAEQLIHFIDKTQKSLSYLNEKDKAYFETVSGESAAFNLGLTFSIENIKELFVKKSITHDQQMILKVRKPDYLGNSMWEFKHESRSIFAKIMDEKWLIEFQKRQFDIRPGDSLKVKMKVTVKYGEDNSVIKTVYEILEIIEILPKPHENLNLFEN